MTLYAVCFRTTGVVIARGLMYNDQNNNYRFCRRQTDKAPVS